MEQYKDWTVGLSGRITGDLGYEYWDSICAICVQVGGACIGCDFKGCKRRYHVRCGIKLGLIRPLTEVANNDSK